MGIDDGSYLPAQSLGNAVELALAVAVLHDLAPAAESAPLRRRRVSPSIGLGQRAARARAAGGLPRHVAPKPGGLLVGIAVFAICHIGPLQVRHEGPALQKSCLRILNAPKARAQVPDGGAVALLELAGPARQGSAVLGAGRRSPDHVKVALREHGHGLAAADVRADGGARLGVKVKAYYLPSQLLEGPAHRPIPENSSSNRGILVFHVGLEGQPYHRSEGGPAASELQVAEGAFPEGLSMLELLAKEPRVAAPESCGAVPHLGRTSLF